jgi:uncharacterized iron-regulated protein
MPFKHVLLEAWRLATVGVARSPVLAATTMAFSASLSLVALAQPALPRLLIFGEQHDQPDQQRQVASEVQQLATKGKLAALVLEMADTPYCTAGLARDASDTQVRDALQWTGWPWQTYADVVMNAVRAGVPVCGGNLPRSAMRAAMGDERIGADLAETTRQRMTEAVRTGHCDMLPAAQLPGMVRIQIARDQSMATVADAAVQRAAPGSVVILLAGAQHAARDRGVPLHLLVSTAWAAGGIQVVLFGQDELGLQADERRRAVFTAQPDYCARMRQSITSKAAATQATAPASTPPGAASAAR